MYTCMCVTCATRVDGGDWKMRWCSGYDTEGGTHWDFLPAKVPPGIMPNL